MRVFKVHVERGRISDARLGQTSLMAPQLHAALEVRVENPHVILSPKVPEWSQLLPGYVVTSGMIREMRGYGANVIDCAISRPSL
jgi:hypothetical protein